MVTVTHYINGNEVPANVARADCFKGYTLLGYACAVEFSEVWNSRGESEEARDMLFEWSGYRLEFRVNED